MRWPESITCPRGWRVLLVPRVVLRHQRHAPARGATIPARVTDTMLRVSIHAPARGATRWPARDRRRPRVSIHAPARGATHLPAGLFGHAPVSIHAPARGATRARCPPAPGRGRFNPRAREGRDLDDTRIRLQLLKFQSTRPRGARPRARSAIGGRISVSIHAPARGATYDCWLTAIDTDVSIHAPARGAT